MTQMNIDLNDQWIQKIIAETGYQFRDCQRKDYDIHARVLPAGYIFANALEQPDSYAAIMSTMHKPIVPAQAVPLQLVNFLNQNGFYQTTGNEVTLCGTQGELRTIKPELFMKSYVIDKTVPQNAIKEYLATNWRLVSRAGENTPSALGICIPINYCARLVSSRGALFMNHPNTPNHGKGDILVVPSANGKLDFSNASPINNAVFSNTFNLNVGGWAQSGLIKRSAATLPFTTDKVKKLFVV